MNSSPFDVKNVRLFVRFRIFFNSRFYYPVFTILFLDFGLTLEQFAILNVVWATSIVLLEVPSGALADIIGRKRLLVISGILMVLEMGLLCVVPRENIHFLFWVFLINRVLSGASEAAASGADEALAYDSLDAKGLSHHWPKVLEKQMRMQSIGFMAAMSIGAAVYDPQLMQSVADAVGLPIAMDRDITIRLPLYLTLSMAILTLMTTIQMEEKDENTSCLSIQGCTVSVLEAAKKTLSAGRWILNTPFALAVILAVLVFENVNRLTVTLISQYFRMIQIPEALFGVIESALALLGIFIPKVAWRMVANNSPRRNVIYLAAITWAGLFGISMFTPYFGLLPVVLLFCSMMMTQFFQSHYMNRMTTSDQRATVLSFKGLSTNLAYGLAGLLYSFLVAMLRGDLQARLPQLTASQIENMAFSASVSAFPWYFLTTFLGLLLFCGWHLKSVQDHKVAG
jgi:MFS family permease